ncbi:MAG: ABC transporter permease [Gemmatimonadaceae bacterium]
MDTLLQDIRYALRSLGASPGFTAIAGLCIALGIAANVFVWSPINAILVRPLPLRDSPRVMHLSTYRTTGSRETYGSWSFPDYRDLAETSGTFAGVGAYSERSWNVGGIDDPERLSGAVVSSSLFPMLGFTPALGRFFRPDEEDGARVAVMSYGVWQRKFAADSNIVGRSITVDGEPFTVVGVMQRDIRFPEIEDIWVPLDGRAFMAHRDRRVLQVAGRLAEGVSMSQAQARVTALMASLETRYGDTNRGYSAWVVPMNDLIAREVRPIFLTMLGAVGFVLLIACANVANLLLARGSGRQREIAVRLAMGAQRRRIVRQLMTESLLLAIVGGLAGILIGSWSIEWFILRMMPTTVPYWMTFDVDRTVLTVSLVTTLVTGLIFGVAPALQLWRPSLTQTLKESGGRGSSGHARLGRMRSTLVVAQLALSLVLLVGAGLMLRSFMATQNAQLGFNAQNLLGFEISPSGTRYESDSARSAFLDELPARLRATPGVQQVALTDQLPIASCCSDAAYLPEGKDYPLSDGPHALLKRASPGLFETLGMPIVTGRSFSADDVRGGNPVVIIDEEFAKREYPDASPLGQRVRVGGPESPWRTVVGVVPHVIARTVPERRSPQVYLPLTADTRGRLWVAVRTTIEPSALTTGVRAAVQSLDPDLPIARLATMDFFVRDRMFQPRVYGAMFAVFAGAALLLATIGLNGVMSYAVSQRRHELGVRMALGAAREDVVRLVLRDGARMVGIALLVGLPAAFVLSQLLRGALYGVTASDPWTYVGISLLLGAVGLLASFIPARRATRVDPMVALRSE